MNKKINNIFKITLLVSLIFININDTFAASECSIEETPEYLEKYLENVHKVVENVNKNVIKKYKNKIKDKNSSKSFFKLRVIQNIQGSLNRLYTWEGYETDIEYIIQGNISEIPKQLKRDVNLLQRESNNLKLSKPEGSNIEITGSEICEGVENCNFKPNESIKSIQVIEKLKKSTNKLKNLIKNQANDYNFRENNTKVYLINPDQLFEEYSKENIKKCNLSKSISGEKGFFATILEKIKKINLLNNYGKDAMSDWKESIALLRGTANDEEYKKKEREILAKELERQGIGGNSASAIISNLDAYNNSKPGDFPFLQGKQGFFNSLQIQIDEFEEALENKFPGYKNGTPADNQISSNNINKEINKLKKIQYQNIDILSEYNKLKSLSLDEDIADDKLINRLIDIHLSISEMINTANKTCFISVKVCNSQKRGQGYCGQCY